MGNYRLDVLGIGEARWTHRDKLYLPEGKKFIIYAGGDDDKDSKDVALLLTKRTEKSFRAGNQ